jgi:hypothetical protein
VWTAALGEAFLALLRETGNARASARALGHRDLFNNRMKRRPDFRQACRAALDEADARLRRLTGPFPAMANPFEPGRAAAGAGIEVKGMPPDDGPPGDGPPPGGRRRPPAPPVLATVPPLETDADALGGYLRPGRKRRPSRPQPVLRRNSRGRMQVSLAREGQWTAEIEADFLARLRATGNFDACARAVGFQPATVHQRERTWPGFERDCAAALAEADVVLTYKLAAHAHALLREPGEAAEAGIEEEEVPFDPVMAMKILAHIDARKYGRSGKGRRKGPPERTFEQACESILAKIEAIERHEKLSHQSGTLMGSGEEGQEIVHDGTGGGDGA